MITYGTNPGMGIGIRGAVPAPRNATMEKALQYMGLTANQPLLGHPIDVVFIGSQDGDTITVPYDKATVKDAPRVDADGELSQDEEAALYRYYGLDYSEARSDSGLPQGDPAGDISGDRTPNGTPGVVGNDVSGPETDHAMTRSEEELRVGTARREAGRARLRKYVVTENVT